MSPSRIPRIGARWYIRARWRVALAAATVAVTTALAGAAPAQADDTWTWSTATHPAGAASIGPLGYGTAGAGVFRWHGTYYIPGVGHIDSPLGALREERETGSGVIGRVAYTTAGVSGAPDVGLIATGTAPIAPRVRVSTGWQDAPVMDVSHPGELFAGRPLCHSGTSPQTIAQGGYRCGAMTADCAPTATQCLTNLPASGGDSGGPVWDYTPGGIELAGWISGTFFGSTVFVPVWALQAHDWTAGQSWSSGGHSAGNDGTGCFVVWTGCVRS